MEHAEALLLDLADMGLEEKLVKHEGLGSVVEAMSVMIKPVCPRVSQPTSHRWRKPIVGRILRLRVQAP